MNVKTFRVLAAAAALAGGVSYGVAADDGTISAGKLARDAKKFYGQTVTVKAEVEDVIDTHMFTLDEDSLLAGADVLVLVPHGVAARLVHDQKVVVTGKVREYVVADLDRDYDFFEDGKIISADKTKIDLDSRPVLIATSVTNEAGTSLLVKPAR